MPLNPPALSGPSNPFASFDPAAILAQITSATEQLLQSAARLTDTDVRSPSAATRFAAQYRQMTPEAWYRLVRWTSGQEHPAARAADSRLTEVLIHHVDLDAGYTPAQWSPDFVQFMLRLAVSALNTRDAVPAMCLTASDTGTDYELGPTTICAQDALPAIAIHGPQHSLLAWLTGRSPGTDLILQAGTPLPKPPPLY